jgi:quinol monooxygenase YgiN
MALTIVANIEAKKNKIEFIKEELLKLIEPTKAEEGCIEYRLQQDNQNPEFFLFFEIWENRELWQKHMDSEHLQNLIRVTEGSLVDLTVTEMNEIGS